MFEEALGWLIAFTVFAVAVVLIVLIACGHIDNMAKAGYCEYQLSGTTSTAWMKCK